MGKNDEIVKSPPNYYEKTLCCFVLDTSGSMGFVKKGIKPIDELNKGISAFYNQIKDDASTAERLEIAIITFNDNIELVQKPTLVESFTPPKLEADGLTYLVDAVNQAIDLVQVHKKWYDDSSQPSVRPWIILITDGYPDDDQDADGLKTKIETMTKNREFVFLTLGVNAADMDFLDSISGYLKDKESGEWIQQKALKISDTKFYDFFENLSRSFQTKQTVEQFLLTEGWQTGEEIV